LSELSSQIAYKVLVNITMIVREGDEAALTGTLGDVKKRLELVKNNKLI